MEAIFGIVVLLAMHLEYCPKTKLYYFAPDPGEVCQNCVEGYYDKYCVEKTGTPPGPPTGVKATKQ